VGCHSCNALEIGRSSGRIPARIPLPWLGVPVTFFSSCRQMPG
jgi:hypothetical protein